MTNCFSRFNDSFENLSHDPAQPYNAVLQTNLHQAFIGLNSINWEPRIGFAWTPLGTDHNTVLRGGVGLFADIFPGTVADNFMRNSPLDNIFTVPTGAIAPTAPGSVSSLAAASNAAFTSAFASGGTLASIMAAVPTFAPPSLFTPYRSVHSPEYQEWNLELEQGLGQKMSFSLNYVGNHGIYEPVQNGVNSYCDVTCLGTLGATTTTGFAGLPAAPLDSRFGGVTEIGSFANSNYNGLTAQFTRRFSQVQLQFNYTWSHALDEISNQGFLPFGFLVTNESILNPINPFNLRQYNYGNADYDTRQYLSANYVWNTPVMHGWKGALGDWTLSGTIFYRTGLPYSAYDSAATGALQAFNYDVLGGFSVLANSNIGPVSCNRSAATTPCVTSSVVTGGAADFSPVLAGFGNQRRNQLYGPNFFDTDLTVMKNFHIPVSESAKLGLGLQFFNLFNHANFDQPVGDVQSSQFGTIIRSVSVPTSILGSFLGGDASPRIVQIKAELSF